jgi:hypothetical protein
VQRIEVGADHIGVEERIGTRPQQYRHLAQRILLENGLVGACWASLLILNNDAFGQAGLSRPLHDHAAWTLGVLSNSISRTILDEPISGDADFGFEMQPTLDGPPMALSARMALPEASPMLIPKVAAAIARVDESTIVRWARRDGIGRQMRKHGPWQIDPLGLQIVMHRDARHLRHIRPIIWMRRRSLRIWSQPVETMGATVAARHGS